MTLPCRTIWLALASVTLAVAHPRPARAQSDADREAARGHFDRGVSLAREARWQDAIRELAAARALAPTAAVHYNLGLAYRAVGRGRAAIAEFESFLRLAGRDADFRRVQQVNGYILALRASTARLTVRLAPATAAIALDAAPADLSAGWVELDAGPHVVLAQAPGYQPVTRVLAVAPGESATLDLRLVPLDVAARVRIECTVGDAVIALDGRAVGHGRADEYVPAGAHTLDVRAAGFTSFHRELVVLPHSATRVRVALADRRSVLARPWFWAVAGVTVATLVAGGVLAFSSTEPALSGALGHVTDAVRGSP